jgi:hypothetical protein
MIVNLNILMDNSKTLADPENVRSSRPYVYPHLKPGQESVSDKRPQSPQFRVNQANIKERMK